MWIEGMEMNVVIGALQNKSFPGRVTMIAPKGKDANGTIKFPVEGDVFNKTNEYIRAGFSANGHATLGIRPERLRVLWDNDTASHEVAGKVDMVARQRWRVQPIPGPLHWVGIVHKALGEDKPRARLIARPPQQIATHHRQLDIFGLGDCFKRRQQLQSGIGLRRQAFQQRQCDR